MKKVINPFGPNLVINRPQAAPAIELTIAEDDGPWCPVDDQPFSQCEHDLGGFAPGLYRILQEELDPNEHADRAQAPIVEAARRPSPSLPSLCPEHGRSYLICN